MHDSQKMAMNEYDADIIIIGSGGGLASAVAAAEKGAKVIVLEKRKVFGGNISLARALFAAESPVQRRLTIDARKEDVFKLAMAFSHWTINPHIIRSFINKSGNTISWLENMGVHFQDVINFFYNQNPRVYHLPEGYGASIVKALVKSCRKLNVKLMEETSATQISQLENNGFYGVSVNTGTHNYQISAKSVIIATGGYSGNKKMLKMYCPGYTENTHIAGIANMGDGITMAQEMGASTEGLGFLLSMGPYFVGSTKANIIAIEPNTIWMNKRGERFVDESSWNIPSESANALDRQPGKISYTLFDESIKQSFIDEGLIRGSNRLYPPGTKITDLDHVLKKEEKKGRVKIAKSLNTIAKWIEADPKVFKKNISDYNHACDYGYDDMFYKDYRYLQPVRKPPFYALLCNQAFHGTTGGIKINHHMEVLDGADRPIPGLYAIGNDTGGWSGDTYNYGLSGTAFGYAINSGRIAGENAADFVNSQIGDSKNAR